VSAIRFPQHAPVDCFDAIGGELAIGGVALTRLAARIGRTPFYAYDRAAIVRRVASLREALPASMHLHYAIKANPMPALVQLLAGLTDGLDVASAQEMQVALDTGTAPARISFAGPGKTAGEIAQAVAAGITVNLESERQLGQALEAGRTLGVAPRLAIRVNPAFELRGSGMKMGGGPKAFGIDEARVPEVAARIESEGLPVVGLHIFGGSQILGAQALIDAQALTVELGLRLAAALRGGIEWLNIGGGFGIPYFPNERPLELAPVAGNLHRLAARAREAAGVPLVLELGRYLVAEEGVYVCRVLDRKVSQDQTFVVTDGGLHHHLAASGNFGQVLRKNYPVAVGNRLDAGRREVQTVVGPLCTPLDLLADRMEMAHAEVGDLIVVFRSGAYGPTASPTRFLSHPPPAEVLA